MSDDEQHNQTFEQVGAAEIQLLEREELYTHRWFTCRRPLAPL